MREDLIKRLRSVKWDVIADGDRMPGDPTRECVFVDMRPDDFEALLNEAADTLEAARKDGWQPIETAPKDGTRVLLWYEWHDLPVVGDFRHGRWWSVHSLGGNLVYNKDEVRMPIATARPAYWRPLPAPPAIDRKPNRSPYNASGSLSEYGIFPECDAALAHGGEG